MPRNAFGHFQRRNTIPPSKIRCNARVTLFTPFRFEAKGDPDPSTYDFEGFHDEDPAFKFVDMV